MRAHSAKEDRNLPARGRRGAPRFTSEAVRHCLRDTAFGPVAVLWSAEVRAPGIVRILLSKPGLPAPRSLATQFSGSASSSCREIGLVLDRIEAFLCGEDIRFSLDTVRLDLCPPFQRRVLRAVHAIRRGRVGTYRLIAARADVPGGARATGTALATNPFPLVIPCHRVIRSDGSPGGYGGGAGMKRALLAMEGVVFHASGKVVLRKGAHPPDRPVPGFFG